jgi:MoaA/NifB/PqqE/SkfB family radical SAM enzyme
MIEITFELTRRCNYNCRHCLRELRQDRSDLAPELIDRILGEGLRFGLASIGLTGGEPTLHPRLGHILDRIVGRGLTYHFVTNGATFGELVLPLLEGRRREQLSSVCFSLDGATAQTHERIRGAGTFESVMRAISLCQVQGIPFGVSFPIGAHNRDEIDQVGLLASHLGARFIAFDHVHPTSDNLQQKIALPLSEWREVERDVQRLRNALSLRVEPC